VRRSRRGRTAARGSDGKMNDAVRCVETIKSSETRWNKLIVSTSLIDGGA
jgi:hypothetical protein